MKDRAVLVLLALAVVLAVILAFSLYGPVEWLRKRFERLTVGDTRRKPRRAIQ